MKKKLYLITLVVALMALVAVPAWAGKVTTSGAPPRTATSDVDVTLSVTVNEIIGIDMSAATVNFTIDPTAAATVNSVDTVSIKLFYNGTGTWHLKADNSSGDFTGTGLTVANIQTQAVGTPNFGWTAFASGGVQELTSASGNLTGWRTSTHSYRYNVQGTESAAAGTYTAKVKYSINSTP